MIENQTGGWHINPKTGNPGRCNPEKTGICRFQKDGEPPVKHYDNEGHARSQYESQMKMKQINSLKKTDPVLRKFEEMKENFTNEELDEYLALCKELFPFSFKQGVLQTNKEEAFKLIKYLVSPTDGYYNEISSEIYQLIAEQYVNGGFHDIKEYRKNRVHEIITEKLLDNIRKDINGKEMSLIRETTSHRGLPTQYVIKREDAVEQLIADELKYIDSFSRNIHEPNGKNTNPDWEHQHSFIDANNLFEVKSTLKTVGDTEEEINKNNFPTNLKLGSYKDFVERLNNYDISFFETQYIIVSVEDKKEAYSIKETKAGRIWDLTIGKDATTQDENFKITGTKNGNPSDFIKNMVPEKHQEWLVTVLKQNGILSKEFSL